MIGPLVSRAQRDRVMGYVRAGLEEGAELVAGGETVGDAGYFVRPTLPYFAVKRDPCPHLIANPVATRLLYRKANSFA